MSFRDSKKRKLSKEILEMKFMKKSKVKALEEQEAEEGEAMFSDIISDKMKHGASKFIIEPSYIPCEDLIVGRLSFHGSNPHIERLMEAEVASKCVKGEAKEEVDVSETEMAERYNSLVGTINKKITKHGQRKVLQKDNRKSASMKKPKFLKPAD